MTLKGRARTTDAQGHYDHSPHILAPQNETFAMSNRKATTLLVAHVVATPIAEIPAQGFPGMQKVKRWR
jgi:hypothetical protein